eukprot:914577-Prymnesium_polylepis.1
MFNAGNFWSSVQPNFVGGGRVATTKLSTDQMAFLRSELPWLEGCVAKAEAKITRRQKWKPTVAESVKLLAALCKESHPVYGEKGIIDVPVDLLPESVEGYKFNA